MIRTTAAARRPLAGVAFAAALLLALGLAACGGSSDDTGAASGTADGSGALGGAPGGSGMSGAPGMPGAAAPGGPRAEWESIAQHLGTLQQQAFSDSAIDAERATMQAFVEDVMADVDPTVTGKLERFRDLQTQLQSPEVSADTSKARPLLQEAFQIQGALRQAQAAAIQRPEVAERTAAFEEKVLAKMKELDPNAESLMARADSLAVMIRSQMADSLAQSMGQGAAPAPGGQTP